MWSSTHRGQRSPDWSEAFALWHTLCGALPVRWRFPPAPHSHHQVSRQRQMGPAQDHLYEMWVSQLYSLNVNLKNQMARLILFFVSSARRSHRYRRHHHKSHHERRKHKRHGSGGHRGQQEGHGHFWPNNPLLSASLSPKPPYLWYLTAFHLSPFSSGSV